MTKEGASSYANLAQNHVIWEDIHHALEKILESAKGRLDVDIWENIEMKVKEAEQNRELLAEAVEHFLFTLLHQIDELQQAFSYDIEREDYSILQSSLQKSEAEIRKHIKIQQQLKIYLDSMQEKIDTYQQTIAHQDKQHSQLIESMKIIDEQKLFKPKQPKIGFMPEKKSKHHSYNSSNLLISDQFHLGEHQEHPNRKINQKPSNSRSKQIYEKINDRARKLNQRRQSQLRFLEGAIHINLQNNIVVSKKNSMECHDTEINDKINGNNLSRNRHQRSQEAVKLQGHAPAPMKLKFEKITIKKATKYHTQSKELEKREARSSSVCY